jgi:hypothetical protein
MKKLVLIIAVFAVSKVLAQTTPCTSNPIYRQFDFWIGEWVAYGLNGKKAGDSKISLVLDSCVILEEWTSAATVKGLTYAGKSFNTYNAISNQWQQTWVDNVGRSTEYLEGKLENNTLIFRTKPFMFSKDTVAIRKLSFFNLGLNKVRQLGEITKNNGSTWVIEYDLEYRRKEK